MESTLLCIRIVLFYLSELFSYTNTPLVPACLDKRLRTVPERAGNESTCTQKSVWLETAIKKSAFWSDTRIELLLNIKKKSLSAKVDLKGSAVS